MRFLPAVVLLLAAAPAVSAVRTVCGVRDGTAGNASLMEHGREAIQLARQGGNQHLLDEADAAVGPDSHGETGTQNGRSYCLRVRFDRHGEPVRVLAGRPVPARPAHSRSGR